MILFVAHDPGAKNHIIPLHRYAVERGYKARFIDLAGEQATDEKSGIAETLKADHVALVVAGCSANGAEWEWIRAARCSGVHSTMMIDIGVGDKLEDVDPAQAPDRFLVTNEHCVRELAERGFPAERACVTGSPHLEHLAAAEGLRLRSAEVKRFYGVDSQRPLVSVFLPSDGAPPEGLDRLHSLLEESLLKDWAMIIRPHPRYCGQMSWEVPGVMWDRERTFDTPPLLAASVCSMTFGSTVSAESWAIGTPSAFFQIGWDYHELDFLYRNLAEIPRIRSTQQFHAFMASVVREEWRGRTFLVERFLGATASGWEVLEELIMRKKEWE
jgi:hypothetical protein